MDKKILDHVEKQLNQYSPKQIEAVLNLMDEGNTVPFIARYRKEMTGALEEVALREIESTYAYQENLAKRKENVLKTIDEQGKLTPELATKIQNAPELQIVEDLYLPYKQKRRTKATIAKENGLAPFAEWLLTFPKVDEIALQAKAMTFINGETVLTEADVIAGAHEILAEQFGDRPDFRQWTRDYTANNGELAVKAKDKAADERQVYSLYYAFSEPLKRVVAHQTLAINRGEKEGILKAGITVDTDKIMAAYDRKVIGKETGIALSYIQAGLQDAYKRFIGTAIERELRNQLTEEASQQAIDVFGDNLKHLLLQAPLKGKIVCGFDPAFRTGCKLAVVDGTGKFLDKTVIYPHIARTGDQPNPVKIAEAAKIFKAFLEKNKVEMIAIGNGTASRESEQFVADVLKSINRPVFYVIVNEAGASVYSASDVARDEFPDFHVEERSAVSIARRLQDPLAELIKIDPKSVGVGQYQHDVPEKQLDGQLDEVVGDVVNQVGVNVNTASPELLAHISGLSATTAKNIVLYRNENGSYKSRQMLKKVPRLGPKAFEQAVGFLRIINGKTILDNTDIHPESYSVATAFLSNHGLTLEDVGTPKAKEVLGELDLKVDAEKLEIGLATLADIRNGLIRPGRDLRDEMPTPLLRHDVLSMADLRPGMKLEGTVRNVIDFGAFVDIGVKQDGLVHISKIAKKFVANPRDIVSVGDIVTVWVDSVDLERKRIQLTMVDPTVERK